MRLADLPGFQRYWLLLSFAASHHEEFKEWCAAILEGME